MMGVSPHSLERRKRKRERGNRRKQERRWGRRERGVGEEEKKNDGEGESPALNKVQNW